MSELREDHLKLRNQRKTQGPSASAIATSPTVSKSKRKTCQIGKCNENKTSYFCSLCSKAVCGKCTGKIEKVVVCLNCS